MYGLTLPTYLHNHIVAVENFCPSRSLFLFLNSESFLLNGFSTKILPIGKRTRERVEGKALNIIFAFI